jgi:small subunit ribosomal protein S11
MAEKDNSPKTPDQPAKAETEKRPDKEKKARPEGEAKAKEAAERADGKPREGGAAPEAAAAPKPVKEKAARTVPVGIVHINATFNNTQVTITDLKGGVLAWSSAGRMGFKGTRKSTAYAATVVAQETAKLVAPYRLQEVEVRVQGPGAGRESAIRALQSAGLIITVIKDVTPMPHNGCRPRKRRRV